MELFFLFFFKSEVHHFWIFSKIINDFSQFCQRMHISYCIKKLPVDFWADRNLGLCFFFFLKKCEIFDFWVISRILNVSFAILSKKSQARPKDLPNFESSYIFFFVFSGVWKKKVKSSGGLVGRIEKTWLTQARGSGEGSEGQGSSQYLRWFPKPEAAH